MVLFAVPGAFTPGCSLRHLPGYIEKLADIKGKKVDVVAVLAYNDAFVMSAWGKANGVENDDIVSDGLQATETDTRCHCFFEHNNDQFSCKPPWGQQAD